MKPPLVSASEFKNLILKRTPVLDVRAPIEFQAGAIPSSFNQPILNDQERHQVGAVYKAEGAEAALRLGHRLISGDVKNDRISNWKKSLEKHPEAVITCFRGGQRSLIAQTWLSEEGIHRPRIEGGYKAFRNYLLSELERLSSFDMILISGPTGSGKTLVVREIREFCAAIDLEGIARHRGSAFGGFPEGGQPSQADFENQLAAELIRFEGEDSLVVEDESRLIGRCAQPESFFTSLRKSGIVMLEEDLPSRVEITFRDYILNSDLRFWEPQKGLLVFQRFSRSLRAISKKLGGMRFAELCKDLQTAENHYLDHFDLEPNKIWIEKLLKYYYDPLYFGSLERRKPSILFRGSRQDSVSWLRFIRRSAGR